MGEYSGLSRWAQCNHKFPYKGKKERRVRETDMREKFKDARLLALEVDEEAMSQEKPAASRSWKRRGIGSPPGPQRKCSTAKTLILAQSDCLRLLPPKLCENLCGQLCDNLL